MKYKELPPHRLNILGFCWTSYEGPFAVRKFDDGIIQVALRSMIDGAFVFSHKGRFVALERVVDRPSKRKRWSLVVRNNDPNPVYPPLYGEGTRYKDFPTALAAYETVLLIEFGVEIP
jgi:hypothetical protein